MSESNKILRCRCSREVYTVWNGPGSFRWEKKRGGRVPLGSEDESVPKTNSLQTFCPENVN